MSKTPCKSFKRDGSPCQGQGLKRFDGYCIAHGPADKVREWRSRGGKNSSTAARADKRIPERMQGIIKNLAEGFTAVREGNLSPAVYTAMCRGAREMRESYRLADEEMEQIRAEETQAAAAEIAGAHGDLDTLKAADEITAQQNQYRIDSLIDQGLATLEQARNPNDLPQPVLTDEGRRRFNYRHLTDFSQQDIDDSKDAARQYVYERQHLPIIIDLLREMSLDMEAALADLTRDPALDPAPPLDPLTGQALTAPPAGVRTGQPPDPDPADVVSSPEILKDLILQVDEQIREIAKMDEDEQYDQKRSLILEGIDPDSPNVQIFTSPA